MRKKGQKAEVRKAKSNKKGREKGKEKGVKKESKRRN